MRFPAWKVDWAGLRTHAIWLSIWLIFYLVWGQWKWRTAEFGSPEWQLDNLGHALGGFLGAINAIYELWYFFPFLYYERSTLRKIVIYLVIPAVILIFAAIWEVGEMLHDFQDYAVQAQKGGEDTTFDIFLAVLLSYPGLFTAHWLNKFLEKFSSATTKLQELTKRAKKLRGDEELLKEEKKELKREYRELRRSQIKNVPPTLWQTFKDVL